MWPARSAVLLTLALAALSASCPASAQSVVKNVVSIWPGSVGARAHNRIVPARNAQAHFLTGIRYYKADGVAQDFALAAGFYRKAALLGHVDAQFALAQMLDNGTVKPEDDQQAIDWYQRAAVAGHPGAQFHLALAYANGDTRPKDIKAAAAWYTSAAEFGVMPAQFNLALLLAMGNGIARDPEQACKWFALAGKDGNEQAARNVAALNAELNDEQRQRVQAAVAAWKPTAIN
jgi:localization factor PodJL